jgi:hypothetical protein
MRKIYITLALGFMSMVSTNMYATAPRPEKHEFKSVEREINFEIERKSGQIALYIQSAFFSTYDQILIERMGEANGGYAACKTIDVESAKIEGDTYVTYDKFPLPAKTSSTYRVKTIAKDGTTKTFPPVQLDPLTR